MIRKALLSIVYFYQGYISIALRVLLGQSASCRYDVTCSDYAINRIKKYGALGLPRVILRILTCQPYMKPYGNFNKHI